eukprot:scaffold69638_cov56-Phaeocystis_antarctica.AAC.2
MADVTGSPGQARNRGLSACLRQQSKLLLASSEEAAHQVLTSGNRGAVRHRCGAGQGGRAEGTEPG